MPDNHVGASLGEAGRLAVLAAVETIRRKLPSSSTFRPRSGARSPGWALGGPSDVGSVRLERRSCACRTRGR